MKVGSLGSLKFEKGWYTYTGSALGSGGLMRRIQRHIKKDKKCFWHIDYLLNNEYSSIEAIICAASNTGHECKIVRKIASMTAKPIKGFGVSDCKEGCRSHLYYIGDNLDEIAKSIVDVYSNMNLMANSYFLHNSNLIKNN